MAKMETARKEDFYKTYTADSLHFILRKLGVPTQQYSEILHPAPVDNRSPDEIARERAARMGLKVVE